MESQVVRIESRDWSVPGTDVWRAALEGGKVLFFPNLAFEV